MWMLRFREREVLFLRVSVVMGQVCGLLCQLLFASEKRYFNEVIKLITTKCVVCKVFWEHFQFTWPDWGCFSSWATLNNRFSEMKQEKGGKSAKNRPMISSSWTAHCILGFFRFKIPSLKMTPRSWTILLSDSCRRSLCPYFQRCDKSKNKPWLLSRLISFVCTDFIKTQYMWVS